MRQHARRRVTPSTVVLEQGPLGTGFHSCFRFVNLEARVKGVIPSPLNIIVSQCVPPSGTMCVHGEGGTNSNCSTNTHAKLSPLSTWRGGLLDALYLRELEMDELNV